MLDSLWEAIDVLEAQENLHAFKISLAPNMTKSGRDNLFKQLQTSAYPKDLYPPKTVSKEDLMRSFGGG